MRDRLHLFAVSLLVLFLELAAIRWFPAQVLFLTFFTNLVLLACFLGMSIGCLAAKHPRNFAIYTLPVAFVGMVLAWLTLMLYQNFSKLNVDVGGQASPQQIFFGTEYRAND